MCCIVVITPIKIKNQKLEKMKFFLTKKRKERSKNKKPIGYWYRTFTIGTQIVGVPVYGVKMRSVLVLEKDELIWVPKVSDFLCYHYSPEEAKKFLVARNLKLLKKLEKQRADALKSLSHLGHFE